jgi:hypothetical protein
VRFEEATGNGDNYVGFRAPASLGGDQVWTLPSSDGTSGQALVTDGSGNLSFTTIAGGGSGDILDGGNTEGADVTIGTNDAFALNLEANGSTELTIDASGRIGIGTAPIATTKVRTYPTVADGYTTASSTNLWANPSGSTSDNLRGSTSTVEVTASVNFTGVIEGAQNSVIASGSPNFTEIVGGRDSLFLAGGHID